MVTLYREISPITCRFGTQGVIGRGLLYLSTPILASPVLKVISVELSVVNSIFFCSSKCYILHQVKQHFFYSTPVYRNYI